MLRGADFVVFGDQMKLILARRHIVAFGVRHMPVQGGQDRWILEIQMVAGPPQSAEFFDEKSAADACQDIITGGGVA